MSWPFRVGCSREYDILLCVNECLTDALSFGLTITVKNINDFNVGLNSFRQLNRPCNEHYPSAKMKLAIFDVWKSEVVAKVNTQVPCPSAPCIDLSKRPKGSKFQKLSSLGFISHAKAARKGSGQRGYRHQALKH